MIDWIRAVREAAQSLPVSREWLYSLALVPAIVLLRILLLRLHLRRHPELEIEEKRRVLVMSRNMALLACAFVLLMVWATEIQTFALSLAALAAATVLALKELIMCLSGSLVRFANKQYSVGDYIEINHIRGRVVDINWLNTLVMQIGPNPLIGRLSGKTISFPNSLLLNFPLYRDNVLGHYVVHMFDIPVPIHLDSDAIVPRLEAVLVEKCSPYIDEIAAYLQAVQLEKLFITPPAQPSISRVPFDDKVYNLVVRFAAPVNLRLDVQQAVLDEFIRVQYRLLNDAGH
ncbi:mechanosensitive ion channel family protein [Conchiformibius kuhniae]|uniref:Mechanosensitive ion channel domain-containing protein n=1 Tax=Conchiformibius kuhniae TaxID=211502 RepID=A0ABD8B794_9NEIS|nr:mechanosensitive ion channel family protein [Conchiformibius kuhniae]